MFGGKTDGKRENGLSIDRDGELSIVQTKIVNFVGSGGGLGIGFPLLDPINKSEEIIPKINGGVGDEKRADAVLDEFVPGKDNIDLGKGENGGKGIGWRVKDETFDRSALEGRGTCFGGGAKVNIGKEERGGVPKMKGGRWDSWAQIIKKKGRFGDQEVIDVKGDASARAFWVFHSAQPTFCTVNPEFGEVTA